MNLEKKSVIQEIYFLLFSFFKELMKVKKLFPSSWKICITNKEEELP